MKASTRRRKAQKARKRREQRAERAAAQRVIRAFAQQEKARARYVGADFASGVSLPVFFVTNPRPDNDD